MEIRKNWADFVRLNAEKPILSESACPASTSEPIDLPAAFDPDFFSAASQLVEGDNLGHTIGYVVDRLARKFFRVEVLFLGVVLRIVGHQTFVQ